MNFISLSLGVVDHCIRCRKAAKQRCYDREHELFKQINWTPDHGQDCWDPFNYDKYQGIQSSTNFEPNLAIPVRESQRIPEEAISPRMRIDSFSSRTSVPPGFSTTAPRHSDLWNEHLKFYDAADWVRYGVNKGSISPSYLPDDDWPCFAAEAEIVSPKARSVTGSPPEFVLDDWLVEEYAEKLDGEGQDADVQGKGDGADPSFADAFLPEDLFSYLDDPPVDWDAGAADFAETMNDDSPEDIAARKAAAVEELEYVDQAIFRCADQFDERVEALQKELQKITAAFDSKMQVLKSRKVNLHDQIADLTTARTRKRRSGMPPRDKDVDIGSLSDDCAGSSQGGAKRRCLPWSWLT
ncbi:hypothetical protein BJX64DRAFT_294982 [Aspergillus heterothallicus]